MITTLDGVERKDGEKVWVVVKNLSDTYSPATSRVGDDLMDTSCCWAGYDACKAEVTKLNANHG